MLNSSIASSKKSAGSVRSNRIFATAHKRTNSMAAHMKSPSNMMSPGMPSRYAQGLIPTENLKFGQFLDIIFGTNMQPYEIKAEVTDYMTVLETNYNEKIKTVRQEVTRLKK